MPPYRAARRGSLSSRIIWLSWLLFCLGNCAKAQITPTANRPAQQAPSVAPPDDQTFTLVGAGDIAGCKAIEGAQATAKLIEQIPGTVFAAGDLAYGNGYRHELPET